MEKPLPLSKTQTAELPECQLPDIRRAAAITGFSEGTLRHWVYGARPAPAGFPKPVKVGGKAVRWRLIDLQAWIDGLGAGHGQHQPSPEAAPDALTLPIIAPPERRRPGRPRKAEAAGGQQ